MRRAHAVETRARSRKREKQRQEATIRIQRKRSDVSDDHANQGVKDASVFGFFLTDFSVSKRGSAKEDEQGNIEVRHARNRVGHVRCAQVTSAERAEFLRMASQLVALEVAVGAVVSMDRCQRWADRYCNSRAELLPQAKLPKTEGEGAVVSRDRYSSCPKRSTNESFDRRRSVRFYERTLFIRQR